LSKRRFIQPQQSAVARTTAQVAFDARFAQTLSSSITNDFLRLHVVSVEQTAGHGRQPRSSATPSSAVAGVEEAAKGGRSPAKRTLEGVRNANKLKGLGLVAAFRG
jgi:hypothetical protein